MKIFLHYSSLFVSLFVLISCGSNSMEDPVKSTTEEVNGYYFSETKDRLVIDTYKSYEISFKLNKDGFAAAKRNVRFSSFDSTYGMIEKSSIVTDSEGRGKFIYRLPEKLPAHGTTYTVHYVFEINGTNKYLTQNIVLQFAINSNTTHNGKISNLSINYLTTTCDAQQGVISHYNVHASDLYSNEPIVGMSVESSLINGIKVKSKYGKLENNTLLKFFDSTVNFLSKGINTSDNLIILPTQKNADINYVGGWKIDDVGESLQLQGTYDNINNTNNLTYMIGNEKRLLGGFNGNEGIPTVANVKIVNAITDSNGFAYFDVVYDPALAGHNVVLEVHGNRNNQRFGISKTEFLRTEDFVSDEIEIPNNGNEGLIPMHIWIQPGCVGEVSALDISVAPSSFTIEPRDHCMIDVSKGIYNTGSSGNVNIYVRTDGNMTESKICKLKWEGGAHSLR